ncbi:MAG TPA: NTP transferase domain-containing protein [Candidatus Nitrosopolaris sp.]|nr:NTP transferase domain-containing protein [Candidatus Nitrosopolaris sp.]
MIAALMCGGRGTRMGVLPDTEKPLLKLKGSTMIDLVLRALVGSGKFEKIVAITSLNTPKTYAFMRNHHYSCIEPIDIIETGGISYSEDLSVAVCKFKPARVFVVSADLPLLNSKIVQNIVFRCLPNNPCVSILLEKKFVVSIGIKPSIVTGIRKGYCHSGITILDSSKVNREFSLDEHYIVMNEKELAVNVNTTRELEIAERMLDDQI